MMQHVGRGSVRKIGENAVAGEMTAYIHTDTTKFRRLAVQYKNCSHDVIRYEDQQVGEPSGRVDKIVWHIREQGRTGDIDVRTVEEALGFETRRYKDALLQSWDLKMLGYRFEPGERGRGHSAKVLCSLTKVKNLGRLHTLFSC